MTWYVDKLRAFLLFGDYSLQLSDLIVPALTLLLLFPAISFGQFLTPESEPEPVEPRSLEQLAMAADLVALVQVADTDYAFTRGFPSGGTAFLKVLIPYKVTRPLEEFLEVRAIAKHRFPRRADK